MTKPSPTRAPRGVHGTCRNRRRPHGARPAWVRPIRRAQRALDASVRLIVSCLATVDRSEDSARQRPMRTSRNLWDASGRLVIASRRLMRAAQQIAETNEWIGREPERAAGAPVLVIQATERWVGTAILLRAAAGEVFDLHGEVLDAIEAGLYVPERDLGRRPRIVLAPRPVPVRSFLRTRRCRVTDRISPILRRRRRTPRPAALIVPPRTSQGRAPPLPSVCPL